MGNYRLKMKSSRNLLSEVDRKYPTLPFTTRNFTDERTAKMGVTECVTHGLLIPYPSLHEKPGAHVAHFKCTVLLLPSGTSRISGLELPDYFKTDKTPDETSIEVLKQLKEEEEKKAKKKLTKERKKRIKLKWKLILMHFNSFSLHLRISIYSILSLCMHCFFLCAFFFFN